MNASSSENSDETTRLLGAAQLVNDDPDTIQAKPTTPLPKAKLTSELELLLDLEK